MGKEYHVAAVGVTNVIGTRTIESLTETGLLIASVRLLASKRSAGQEAQSKGQPFIVEELALGSLEGIDLALFSAGGSIPEKFALGTVKRGAVIADNTSHFRMARDAPLIAPEMNPEALKNYQGIIASPNCSTVQMMVTLKPIRQAFGLERIIASTHQVVNDVGVRAISELKEQTEDFLGGKPVSERSAETSPAGSDEEHYPIAFNALPQIDVFSETGYIYEEWKVMNGVEKVMGDNKLKVVATCVRIPVISGHSELVYIETKQADTSVPAIRELMAQAPGVVLQDRPGEQLYPRALDSANQKETFVGYIRQGVDVKNGLRLWIVPDNLLKGVAWNLVQTVETLREMNLLRIFEND